MLNAENGTPSTWRAVSNREVVRATSNGVVAFAKNIAPEDSPGLAKIRKVGALIERRRPIATPAKPEF